MDSFNRTYQQLQPQSEWVRESGSNTLVIDLPGFKKEQLRVQLDNLGNLKISGERQVSDNKWARFAKDFRIPDNSNLNEIRAKFEKGTLYVIIPTSITQTAPPPQQSPPTPMPTPTPTPTPTPPSPSQKKPTQKDETERKTRELEAEQKQKVQPSLETTGKVASGKEEKSTSPPAAQTPLGAASGKPAKVGGLQGLLTNKKSNQLVVNMLVSFLVVVGIGIYVAYKFKAATAGERTQD